MAKPYSSSHIGFVASGFTEMRLSGAVKERIVQLMVDEVSRMVPEMEAATLSANPDKKTLDDTNRTRLNYNRTRELMIERLDLLESVGSEAVQAGIEHLETFLKRLLSSAEQAASKDRVATIKPRHLELAEKGLIVSSDTNSEENTESQEIEEDLLEGQVSGSALTPMALRKMARTFAGMPITDAAVEELLLWYYEVVDETGQNIREHAQLGANPASFIESLDRMKDLMMLGWIRRMLARAGVDANERGYKRIDVEQLIHLDPFE
jgi:histone H3/H4|tara:strand:- start:48 stop:842 length:795 start_codon:yes stop_codon:yes gene_type:complete